MPAAAKLLADNNLKTGDVAGTGKDGRVTKGDVLGAVAAGAKPGRAGAAGRTRRRRRQAAAGRRRAGDASLGDRPEQRVPMIAPARPHRRAPAAVAVDRTRS